MNSLAPPRAAPGDLGPSDHPPSRHSRRPHLAGPGCTSGLTLIEMLVAMAITLILMFAVVQIFAILGESVSAGRSTIEMSGQLRFVAGRLEEDLAGLTVPVRPWIKPESGLGYFEYIEGPGRDFERTLITNALFPAAGDAGDVDDVLMFTVRSMGEPFTGRVQGKYLIPPVPGDVIIESPVAEIIWWTSQTSLDDKNNNYNLSTNFTRDYVDVNVNGLRDPDGLPAPAVLDGKPHPDDLPEPMETVTLYRRMLLVRPDIVLNNPPSATTVGVAYEDFFNHNDISARLVNPLIPANGLIANSLSDLTKRENRFAHLPSNLPGLGGFPFPLNREMLFRVVQQVDPISLEDHTGEDVILSHVMAFDIKVYDSAAILRLDGNAVLVPSDPGYRTNLPPTGRGAYVDLNYDEWESNNPIYATGFFSGRPHSKSKLFWSLDCAYDTWSFHYENDGLDQDDRGLLVDEGTNGMDDKNDNNNFVYGVDDIGERETSPPYPVPLRGLEVKIRIIEQDAQAIRQVRVVADFVPE